LLNMVTLPYTTVSLSTNTHIMTARDT
jgi:hypothetical protein